MNWKQPLRTRWRRLRQWAVSGLHFSAVATVTCAETDRPGGPVAAVTATPRREMSTDRPDTTESPYTIEPRHVQVEADLASHTRNQRDGHRTREWSAGTFNLRLGLRQNLEAGIFVAPWTRTTEEPPGGPRRVSSGFGDITLRGKLNFRGNEGDRTATGVILDLKLPTAARGQGNDAVEGDIIFPVAGELGGGWEFGAMTRLDLRARETGPGRRAVFVNTVTTGHALAPRLDGYVELASEAGDGAHVVRFDTGVAFRVNPETQWDAGVKLGLSRAADDFVGFAGFSRRF